MHHDLAHPTPAPLAHGAPAPGDLRPPDRAEMMGVADELHMATEGWLGPDTDAVRTLLRGRSAAETALIRSQYADRYHVNLDDVMHGQLGAGVLEEVDRALAGDRVGAAVAGLRNGSDRAGTNEDVILSVLGSIGSPEERAAVLQQFAGETGTSVPDMLRAELSGYELDRALALAHGDVARERAAALEQALSGGWTGVGTDEVTANAVLASVPATMQPSFQASMLALTGQTVDQRLADEMGGDELERARAFEHRDAVGLAALDLADAMGEGPIAVCNSLETLASASDREAAITRYDHGRPLGEPRFDAELAARDPRERTVVEGCVATGAMSRGARAHYASVSAGTDEEELIRSMEDMTQAERPQADAELAQYGESMSGLAHRETSGDLEHELEQDAAGRPETRAQAMDRARADAAYYRGSGAGLLGNSLLDGLGYDDGRLLDGGLAAAEARFARDPADPLLEAELADLEQYGENYRVERRAVADGAATAAELAAATVATVATSGAAAPLLTAVAAGGTGMITKGLLLGRGYGDEEQALDLTRLAAEFMLPEVAELGPASRWQQRITGIDRELPALTRAQHAILGATGEGMQAGAELPVTLAFQAAAEDDEAGAVEAIREIPHEMLVSGLLAGVAPHAAHAAHGPGHQP